MLYSNTYFVPIRLKKVRELEIKKAISAIIFMIQKRADTMSSTSNSEMH